MYPPQPLRSHFEQEILALEQQLWRLRSDKARSALRDSDEPNYLNSPKRAAAPTVQRSYSAESQMAMDDLAVVSDEAARLQRISEQAEVQLRLAERFGEPVDPALRNQCGTSRIRYPLRLYVQHMTADLDDTAQICSCPALTSFTSPFKEGGSLSFCLLIEVKVDVIVIW